MDNQKETKLTVCELILEITSTPPPECGIPYKYPELISKATHIINTIGDKPTIQRLQKNKPLLKDFQKKCAGKGLDALDLNLNELWEVIYKVYTETHNREFFTHLRIVNQQDKKTSS